MLLLNLYDRIEIDCIQKYLERKGEVMELQSLMLALLVWIGAHSDLGITNIQLPTVEFVSPSMVQKISGLKGDIAAVYDEVAGKMYFKNSFDPKNVIDQGYLMHELFHHIQFANQVWYRNCTAEYEREAYRLTNLWFVEHELPETYSAANIILWGICPEKD